MEFRIGRAWLHWEVIEIGLKLDRKDGTAGYGKLPFEFSMEDATHLSLLLHHLANILGHRYVIH